MNGVARGLVLAAVIVIAGQEINGRPLKATPLRQALATFPLELEGWHGYDGEPIDPAVTAVLGADAYLNRVYANGPSHAGAYVAYYGSQQQGDSIHSPLHCLPGNGWMPVSRTRVMLHGRDTLRNFSANEYIVEKGGVLQLVLYWFQGRGRVVASEYWNKAYLLADALRLRRTDGALVRVMTPLSTRGADASTAPALPSFAVALESTLTRWLP